MAKEIERSEERIKQTGEVFTPAELVETMMDFIPEEVWKDSSKKWIDTSFGEGAFLIEVQKRLHNNGHNRDHVITNMLYGIEKEEDNYKVCLKNLGITNDDQHHLVCGDTLTYDFDFSENEFYGLFDNSKT